jgi:metal-dependent hydrolase (beta-lactamase superfamily II)
MTKFSKCLQRIAGMDLNELDHIPCRCTGRKAIMQVKQAMPGQFILNMSGTTLTFRA